MLDDPCDRSALADDSCSHSPLDDQAPPPEFTVQPASWHQQAVEQQQVVESYNIPFHPPEPSAAFMPAPGPKAAMLLPSVQGVNSKPLQSIFRRNLMLGGCAGRNRLLALQLSHYIVFISMSICIPFESTVCAAESWKLPHTGTAGYSTHDSAVWVA